MSKSQRRKGADGEREAVALLSAVYPLADRNPMQSRGAGRDGCDVEGTPWWVEVKSCAKPAPIAALRQADRDSALAEDPRPSIVMAKQTRHGWTVTLSWGDFERLVSEGQAARAAAVIAAKESERVMEKPMEAREILWNLLDDISTQDDACSRLADSDAEFRRRVRAIAEKRLQVAHSADGQTLAWAPA